jgi:predicted RNA binding protein YcfA (HicA-like mRNA interferase family)
MEEESDDMEAEAETQRQAEKGDELPCYAVSIAVGRAGGERDSLHYERKLQGTSRDWQVSHVVTEVRRGQFRVVVRHPGKTVATLLRQAIAQEWRVSWIASKGSNTGQTNPGQSGWRAVPGTSSALYLDVNTHGSGFGDRNVYPIAPRYFPNLLALRTAVPMAGVAGGKGLVLIRDSFGTTASGTSGCSGVMLYRTRGSHVVYKSWRQGFRVYVLYDGPITPSQAEAFGWSITWIGASDQHSGSADGWWAAGGDGKHAGARYVHVDAKLGGFQSKDKLQVAFATSLQVMGDPNLKSLTEFGHANQTKGRYLHPSFAFGSLGSSVIFHSSRLGFETHLSYAPPLAQMKQAGWQVNYIGFEPSVCKASAWSSWSKCPHCLDVRWDTEAYKKKLAKQGMLSRNGHDVVLDQKALQAKMANTNAHRAQERYRQPLLRPMRCSNPRLLQRRKCAPCTTRTPTAKPTGPSHAPTRAPTHAPTNKTAPTHAPTNIVKSAAQGSGRASSTAATKSDVSTGNVNISITLSLRSFVLLAATLIAVIWCAMFGVEFQQRVRSKIGGGGSGAGGASGEGRALMGKGNSAGYTAEMELTAVDVNSDREPIVRIDPTQARLDPPNLEPARSSRSSANDDDREYFDHKQQKWVKVHSTRSSGADGHQLLRGLNKAKRGQCIKCFSDLPDHEAWCPMAVE